MPLIAIPFLNNCVVKMYISNENKRWFQQHGPYLCTGLPQGKKREMAKTKRNCQEKRRKLENLAKTQRSNANVS